MGTNGLEEQIDYPESPSLRAIPVEEAANLGYLLNNLFFANDLNPTSEEINKAFEKIKAIENEEPRGTSSSLRDRTESFRERTESFRERDKVDEEDEENEEERMRRISSIIVL